MKSLIYIRVSTEKQVEGTSLAKQREWALSLLNGGSYEIFEEPGRSGEDIEKRPAFRKLLKMISAGQADGSTLYAYDQDRLSRSMADWAHDIVPLFALHDIHVITAQGEMDLQKRDQRLMSHIKGGLADWHRSYIVEESKKGKRRVWAEGFYPGSRPPVGMRFNKNRHVSTSSGKKRPTIEPIPEYIEHIESIFIWSSNMRLFEILDRLPSINGTILNETQLRRILRQPLYAGHVKGPDGKLLPCPQVDNPIIPLETFLKVSGRSEYQIRTSTRHRRYKRVKHALLTPIAYCGYCGSKYNHCSTWTPQGTRWRGYQCTGYHYGHRKCLRSKAHTAGVLEQLTIETIKDYLADREALRVAYNQSRAQVDDKSLDMYRIDKELDGLHHKMDNLVNSIASGEINCGEVFRSRIQRQITKIEGLINLLNFRKKELLSQKIFPPFSEIEQKMSTNFDQDSPKMRGALYNLVEKIRIYRKYLVVEFKLLPPKRKTIPAKKRKRNNLGHFAM